MELSIKLKPKDFLSQIFVLWQFIVIGIIIVSLIIIALFIFKKRKK
jgi:LPXTG-motif cell wall-anchored protein